jgi:hypothetical protein
MSLENRLLAYLQAHPQAELSRQQIMDKFFVSPKNMDATLTDMRRKGLVETVHVTRLAKAGHKSQMARPAGMPDYTAEQKAAAFDALWQTCGLGMGSLKDWVHRDISRPGCPPNEATIMRVPRYSFELLAEGEDMHRFRDVLHHLATRLANQEKG